jgi:coenzyme PQQ precursor peptide PqqA
MLITCWDRYLAGPAPYHGSVSDRDFGGTADDGSVAKSACEPLLARKLRSILENVATRTSVTGGTDKGTTMTWTTPILVEICVGLEINGYLPAEF